MESQAAEGQPAEGAQPDGGGPGRDELKRAMKAFRKRMKLTRLDQESKLGRSPLTGGRKSSIDAIMPPRQYGPEVWAALVEAGKLKDAGGGFYSLVEQ